MQPSPIHQITSLSSSPRHETLSMTHVAALADQIFMQSPESTQVATRQAEDARMLPAESSYHTEALMGGLNMPLHMT